MAVRLPAQLARRWSLPWRARRGRVARCRTALSRAVALELAVAEIVRDLSRQTPRRPRLPGQAPQLADLALVFCSTAFASDLQRLLPLLREAIPARHWLGCAGGGVVGTGPDGLPHELEQQPALSVTLLDLPGADLQLFQLEGDALPDLDGPGQQWIQWVGADPQRGRSMLLFVDPGCPAINDLISGLDYAYPGIAKVGGIAGQHSATHGSLFFDDRVVGGAVGCLIGGRWRIEPVVAQGCRPIGPVFAVEKAERNVLQLLSAGDQRGTPVACLQAILETLPPAEKELVRNSLFLGVARSSFQLGGPDDGLQRPAFLVRNLIGVDPRNGAVAVAERVRVGQQVQFQLRDAGASRQEQEQLLGDLQRRVGQPLAALLFACLGRGEGLYGRADGDVELAGALFPRLPIAGAFCNGEIGPVDGTTHLHGYTASWGFLLDDPTPEPEV
ncbi:FIST N-terminal domain-containing protein [Vulcanococcus limneticus]|uniref:FIST signal transduction protein n=1 Tax=Vulcanococcus limneticus TaxID=2170428 RepID=UPI000B9938E9|nr:FIST N-terminal domain-containing protein [Vulcanococcus limneticus]MCP9790228.1 FIST C-terminal domain-containing protein [Vulcanococcus limneticus MW73D5]MCP9894686.1 FIST C-terminal domain-containing protein [Vulcanococcus limneticus Candia 3F8]MCP9895627.1 FIST C-terminal domain-containing protein [Vulcanococcus limneticus Candia 3B3]